MTPEAAFTDKVRRALRGSPTYSMKLNLRFQKGPADSWYSGPANDLWVEYKHYTKLPAVIDLTKGQSPKLSRLQHQWLTSRASEGRNVWIIIGHAQIGIILRSQTEWSIPLSREEFLSKSVPIPTLCNVIRTHCERNLDTASYSPTMTRPISDTGCQAQPTLVGTTRPIPNREGFL